MCIDHVHTTLKSPRLKYLMKKHALTFIVTKIMIGRWHMIAIFQLDFLWTLDWFNCSSNWSLLRFELYFNQCSTLVVKLHQLFLVNQDAKLLPFVLRMVAIWYSILCSLYACALCHPAANQFQCKLVEMASVKTRFDPDQNQYIFSVMLQPQIWFRGLHEHIFKDTHWSTLAYCDSAYNSLPWWYVSLLVWQYTLSWPETLWMLWYPLPVGSSMN